MISGCHGYVQVWGSQKGKQVASLMIPCPLNCVTFNPEGGLLAVGCWDGAVRLWDWIKQERWKVRKEMERDE